MPFSENIYFFSQSRRMYTLKTARTSLEEKSILSVLSRKRDKTVAGWRVTPFKAEYSTFSGLI